MATPDGGPAFPRIHSVADANDPAFKLGCHGMSLRDYFAAHAPAPPEDWLSRDRPSLKYEPILRELAWRWAYADAMVAKRENG